MEADAIALQQDAGAEINQLRSMLDERTNACNELAAQLEQNQGTVTLLPTTFIDPSHAFPRRLWRTAVHCCFPIVALVGMLHTVGCCTMWFAQCWYGWYIHVQETMCCSGSWRLWERLWSSSNFRLHGSCRTLMTHACAVVVRATRRLTAPTWGMSFPQYSKSLNCIGKCQFKLSLIPVFLFSKANPSRTPAPLLKHTIYLFDERVLLKLGRHRRM